MFKHKRTRRLGVALGTYRILIGSRLQLLALESAMRIMAIAAGHQPFIHFVMEGLSERRFHLRMAGVTKIGLRNFEQILFVFEVMHAVTVRAADFGFGMRRALEIRVRSGMTIQTPLVNFLRRSFFEDKYLALVATTVDMVRSGTMATLATLVGGAAFLIQHRLPVRRLFPSVVKVLVTGLTGLRTHVLGIASYRRTGRRHTGRLTGTRVLTGPLLSGLSLDRGNKEKTQGGEQKNSNGT